MSDDLINEIDEKIYELGDEHVLNPGVILTETDMQCLLYNKLLSIESLSQLSNTKDGYGTYSVHTELSWFNLDGKLTLKPDITILQPEFLTITSRKNVDLPNKGFMFGEGGIIFELKFNRYKSIKSFVKSVKNDLEKINNLQRIHPNTICYFVWFDKYSTDSDEINSLINNNPSKKIIYIKGSIETEYKASRSIHEAK